MKVKGTSKFVRVLFKYNVTNEIGSLLHSSDKIDDELFAEDIFIEKLKQNTAVNFIKPDCKGAVSGVA